MGVPRPAKQNAITNSPFVRALIKPVMRNIIPAPLSPPKQAHLLPTQPKPAATAVAAAAVEEPVASTSQVVLSSPASAAKGKKRAREEDSAQVGKDGKVVVSFTRKNLPRELNKYWAQRYRLFSLFDSGVQMDLEGWYSVTPELIAAQIAERCRSSVIVDAFCGVGGNAIQFAFTCERVVAIDIDPTRLACARHNAEIYGVEDRIEFVLADYTEWAGDYAQRKARGEVAVDELVEVVFLSPPWGGLDYLAQPGSAYPLSALGPIAGDELFDLSRKVSPHVAYYLPRNIDVAEVAGLPARFPRSDRPEGSAEEVVELEEEYTSGKLKAITCYYGDLAHAAAAA